MNTSTFRRVDEMIKEAQNKDLGVNKNGSCDVYVDMSLLDDLKQEQGYLPQEEENSAEDSVKNLKLLGLKSSMDKDERIFKLQTMITQGEIKTVQRAIDEFNTSKPTIIKYLLEIKLSLKDEDTNKRVGFIDNNYSPRKDSSASGFNYLDPITREPISKAQHKQNIKVYQEEKSKLLGES